ncbi:uncharacterized protein GBIM_18596, partial [Gryllus bimaculatus]
MDPGRVVLSVRVRSYVSGVTLLGAPAEVYVFGGDFALAALGLALAAALHALVFLPTLHRLRLTSAYEGGLRAVVWADVAQTVAMVVGVLLVAAKGTADAGGFGAVWSRARDGGRLDPPQWSVDPTVRHSVWAVLLGGGAYWLQANAVNQNQAQRYLALPTLRSARIAAALFAAGAGAIVLLCCYCGLLLYAFFHDCDPISSRVSAAT